MHNKSRNRASSLPNQAMWAALGDPPRAANCSVQHAGASPHQAPAPGQAAPLGRVGRTRSSGVVVLQDPRGRLRVDAHHARHG